MERGLVSNATAEKTGGWKMPPDLVIRTSLISFNISVALTEAIF